MMPGLAELLAPYIFREAKNLFVELTAALVLGIRRAHLSLAAVLSVLLARINELIENVRIDAEVSADQHEDERADAADGELCRPHAATIFQVVAFSALIQIHDDHPLSERRDRRASEGQSIPSLAFRA